MAETVFISLPTPDIVREVALGGNGGLINGSTVRTVIDLSTTGPGVATEVAGKLAERKIGWVDSPVSGGVTGAKAGTLAVMVACPKPTYRKLEPVLKMFGKLFYAGEKPGLAQTAKLANNLLAATAHGGDLGSDGDGRQGRPRPQGADRHHQRLERPQQRHARTSSRAPSCRAPSTSASRPASPTRTCGCASRKPRRWACRWWWAAPCARCWP